MQAFLVYTFTSHTNMKVYIHTLSWLYICSCVVQVDHMYHTPYPLSGILCMSVCGFPVVRNTFIQVVADVTVL